MRAWLLAVAVSLVSIAPALAADPLRQGAEAVRDRALADTTAYDYVASLTTEVGERLAGTEAAARARDWGVAKLKSLGFSDVHVEPFTITAWVRGPEKAEVTAPYPQSLSIIGLGGSVPTPPGGVEAEVVVFATYADLLAAPLGSLTGKIAVVTQPMPRAQDGAGYGALNPNRRAGPSEAARRGAIAYLVRSLATGESRAPHTGALNYKPDVPQIPAAALSVVDAELLDRMAALGKPIRIRLSLESHTVPNAPAWSVVGEIPGTEHPDQLVVVGGHLDSWDPGQGAIDDGAGMAIAVAAAHLAGAHPPKRTLRVMLFGAEEMDFTRFAVFAAHQAEIPRTVLMGEADIGADRAWSVALPAGSLTHPAMQAYAAAVAPIGVIMSPEPARGGGDDIVNMVQSGVPVVAVRQDASRYFDWHHSSEDTLDKIDKAQFSQAVATWATLLYVVANSDIDFRSLAPVPPTAPAPPPPAPPPPTPR